MRAVFTAKQKRTILGKEAISLCTFMLFLTNNKNYAYNRKNQITLLSMEINPIYAS